MKLQPSLMPADNIRKLHTALTDIDGEPPKSRPSLEGLL
jgi:hypothetical protein